MWIRRQDQELGEVFTWPPRKKRAQQAASCSHTQPGQHRRAPLPSLRQETPLAGASSAESHGSANPPASRLALLTRASFLPSPPSQLFVPHPSTTAPSELPTSRPPSRARAPWTEYGSAWRGVGHLHKGLHSIPQHHPACSTESLSSSLDARTCHTAPSSPDTSPYPGSTTSSSGPWSCLPQAAQDHGLAACLAKVSGSAPRHERTRVAPLSCDHQAEAALQLTQ